MTGGSRDIGKAVCVALAGAGAKVILTYQTQQSSAEKVAEVIDGGAKALWLDVCNGKSISAVGSLFPDSLLA